MQLYIINHKQSNIIRIIKYIVCCLELTHAKPINKYNIGHIIANNQEGGLNLTEEPDLLFGPQKNDVKYPVIKGIKR